jgi:hypothetical protein
MPSTMGEKIGFFCTLVYGIYGKITYLLNPSILYYSSPPPNSSAPKRSNAPPPFVPRRSRLRSYPSPVAPAYFWLVVASFELVGSHQRPRRVLFLFFFLLRFDAQFQETTHTHRFRPGRVSSPTYPQCRSQLLFDCCVPLLNGGHLRLMVRPPLSIFAI